MQNKERHPFDEIQFVMRESSAGTVLIAKSERGLCAIMLGDDRELLQHEVSDRFSGATLAEANVELETLAAKVVAFVESPTHYIEVPLDLRGTDFQLDVWAALRDIPAGETASYTEIAERIGRPKAVRAVAQACAANALALIIPCHRVVRRDGSLSGYRWGIERKRILLEREAAAYPGARARELLRPSTSIG